MSMTAVIQKIYNKLEPQSYIDAYVDNPPEGFEIKNITDDDFIVYGFLANLDLFTTLDESLMEYIDKLRSNRVFKWISRLFFNPRVRFIGASVSEYALFPGNLQPDRLAGFIAADAKKSAQKFTIIKDIPMDSPVLSDRENEFSRQLISSLEKNDFQIVSGQALGYLPINFSSLDEYLNQFSSKKRNDLKRKMKTRDKILVREFATGDEFFTDDVVEYFYELYLNVFNNSNMQFDILTSGFFRQIFQDTFDGIVFISSHDDKIIGFDLCYVVGDVFLDKYRGHLYPECQEFKLFFNQCFYNIEYCIKNNLKNYFMSGAIPKTKSLLGCEFTFTYHAVYLKSPFFRFILKKFKPFFEADNIAVKGM